MMGAERRSMVMTDEEKRLTRLSRGRPRGGARPTSKPPTRSTRRRSSRAGARSAWWCASRRATGSRSAARSWKRTSQSPWAVRIAEEMIFGYEKVTSGASSDLKMATSDRTQHGDAVRHVRRARAAQLQRERAGSLPRPLDSRSRRTSRSRPRTRSTWRSARSSTKPMVGLGASFPTIWNRYIKSRTRCSNTNPLTARRSPRSSRANRSCGRTTMSRWSPRDGAARCPPPADARASRRPISNPIRNRARDRRRAAMPAVPLKQSEQGRRRRRVAGAVRRGCLPEDRAIRSPALNSPSIWWTCCSGAGPSAGACGCSMPCLPAGPRRTRPARPMRSPP